MNNEETQRLEREARNRRLQIEWGVCPSGDETEYEGAIGKLQAINAQLLAIAKSVAAIDREETEAEIAGAQERVAGVSRRLRDLMPYIDDVIARAESE